MDKRKNLEIWSLYVLAAFLCAALLFFPWRFYKIATAADCLENFFSINSILGHRDAALYKDNIDGMRLVCRADMKRFHLEDEVVPIDQISEKPDFEPVKLDDTRFTELIFIGGKTENVLGKTSILYRVFRKNDGRAITLVEHEMSVDGVSVGKGGAIENSLLNGKPVRLTVLHSYNGDAISFVDWIDGTRYFQLWIDENVIENKTKKYFFSLAESLSRRINYVNPVPNTVRIDTVLQPF